MLSLDTVNRTLEIVLAGAVTTAELVWVTTYTLYTTSGITPGSSHGLSNGVTPVEVMPAPGAGQFRQLKWLSVRNADTDPATVLVAYKDGATVRSVWSVTLDPGDTLWYMDGAGLAVIAEDGSTKGGGAPITLPLGIGSGGTGATTASGARTALGVAIGADVQAWDAFLDDIAGLADPGADRLLFWDDSAGELTWLTPGSGLTITGTTIDAAGGSPAGADGQVQYNNGGAFGGDADLHWHDTDKILKVDSSGTSNQAVWALNGSNAAQLASASFGLRVVGEIHTDQATGGVTTPGAVQGKMPVYDGGGTLIGYAALYDTIT